MKVEVAYSYVTSMQIGHPHTIVILISSAFTFHKMNFSIPHFVTTSQIIRFVLRFDENITIVIEFFMRQ